MNYTSFVFLLWLGMVAVGGTLITLRVFGEEILGTVIVLGLVGNMLSGEVEGEK